MSNKVKRETAEMKNLFEDPKFVRKAWRSVGNMLANRPAVNLPAQYDKDGAETLSSMIASYSYNSLCKDLKQVSSDAGRDKPTELEVILMSQLIRARYDTGAATFVRDTLGAKPIDESKVEQTNINAYEQLTDEELELLAAHRAERTSEQAESDTDNTRDSDESPDARSATQDIVEGDA